MRRGREAESGTSGTHELSGTAGVRYGMGERSIGREGAAEVKGPRCNELPSSKGART